jgi:hypothetical protein
MKNTNIAESVFKVNLKYVELQNQTKELFFRCLDEGRDILYFKAKLRDIWGNVDYTFMESEISSYEEQIHEQNMEMFGNSVVNQSDNKKLEKIALATALGTTFLNKKLNLEKIQKAENDFVKQKEKEYQSSLNSLAYKVDKEEYLKLKVQKYTNQIVPYYSTKTGNKIRDVELSTYTSMIHNTNLTRTGWNTTLNDADIVGYKYFIIPYHPFSCEYCIGHQNRIMTREEVIDLIGEAEEQEGDILHPNCKCEIVALKSYNDIDMIESPFKYNYTREEKIDMSKIRQKVNSLTLQKEKVKTDIKIQDMLGNQDQVDILNQKRNKINKEIRQLKEALPTTELKKQVVAINR